MKILSKILALLVIAIFLMVGNGMAYSTLDDVVKGVNITTMDGFGSGTAWYSANKEDNEVEPSMQTGQIWDLEAIYWESSKSTLFMIAGFDFKDGGGPTSHSPDEVWSSGDVFLFGSTFDYVLDFDRVSESGDDKYQNNLDVSGSGNENAGGWSGSFDVYSAGSGELDTHGVYYQYYNHDVSDPYAHDNSTDTPVESDISYFFYGGLGGGTIASGGRNTHNDDSSNDIHYVLALDLSDIGVDFSGFGVHMTLECGNDDIEGQIPVPEPATMLLFGTGLIGLAGHGRKKFQKH